MALNGRQWNDPSTQQYIQELERVIAELQAQIASQATQIANLRRRR